jgi:CDP-glucose 4,6-dehydratase
VVIDSYIKSFFNPKDYQKKHTTLVASVRSGNSLGGGDWQKDRLMPDIIRAVFEKKEKVIIRNPKFIRPWQHVLESLYGYLLLAKKLYEGKRKFSGAWNFGPEKKNYLTVKEIVEKTLKILKRGSYIIKRDPIKHEAEFLRLDISKAKNVLGWKPVFGIDQALQLTLDWYKSFYNKEDIIKITNQQIESFFEKI